MPTPSSSLCSPASTPACISRDERREKSPPQQPFSTEMLNESVLYLQERLPDACLVLQLANSPVVRVGAGPRGAAPLCPGGAVPPAASPGREQSWGSSSPTAPSPTFLLILQTAALLLGCPRAAAALEWLLQELHRWEGGEETPNS